MVRGAPAIFAAAVKQERSQWKENVTHKDGKEGKIRKTLSSVGRLFHAEMVPSVSRADLNFSLDWTRPGVSLFLSTRSFRVKRARES